MKTKISPKDFYSKCIPHYWDIYWNMCFFLSSPASIIGFKKYLKHYKIKFSQKYFIKYLPKDFEKDIELVNKSVIWYNKRFSKYLTD